MNRHQLMEHLRKTAERNGWTLVYDFCNYDGCGITEYYVRVCPADDDSDLVGEDE